MLSRKVIPITVNVFVLICCCDCDPCFRCNFSIQQSIIRSTILQSVSRALFVQHIYIFVSLITYSSYSKETTICAMNQETYGRRGSDAVAIQAMCPSVVHTTSHCTVCLATNHIFSLTMTNMNFWGFIWFYVVFGIHSFLSASFFHHTMTAMYLISHVYRT